MEDRKLNALPDEALDEVAGGAYATKNRETGKYDVYSVKRQFIASYDTEDEAKRAAQRYTMENEPFIETMSKVWLPPA